MEKKSKVFMMNQADIKISGSSPIQSFFKNSSVLVTGGTGFLGKVLIEKLIRCCPELNNIYILIRPKKGQDIKIRHKNFLTDPIFDRVKAEHPENLQKILPIYGDLSEPDLGINNEDMAVLISNVDIIFHSAATVRFDEPMKTAVILNTLGTQRVVEICAKMKKLKAFVYVSTAYTNPDKSEIGEIVYKPPAEPEELMKKCLTLSSEEMEQDTRELQKKHPNTYTLTKAMAEWIVYQNGKKFPTAIVRPSAVTAAMNEPYPGWIDSFGAGTALAIGLIQGTVRTVLCNPNLVADYIPVDYVVNTLIAAAWHIGTYKQNKVKVFNCTSGSLNPIYWHEIRELLQKYGRSIPNNYVMWYPVITLRTNKLKHRICELLFHFLPAVMVDAVLKLQGSKPRFYKWAKRLHDVSSTTEFFCCEERHFHYENVKSLLNDDRDKEMFYVDVSKLDWNKHAKSFILGVRKYLLKETDETIPSARKRIQRLYWIHCLSRLVVLYGTFHIIYFTWKKFFVNSSDG